MNIFKVLSTAHGKVYEPSITAFIAYLLNPYEGHGLKDEFLKLFLNETIGKNADKLNFLKEKNEIEQWNFKDEISFEILAEQSFSREPDETEEREDESPVSIPTTSSHKKEIVDIIIAVYEKTSTKQRQYEAEKKLKIVFLVENKISRDAEKETQLYDQHESSREVFQKNLGDNMPLIGTIFLSIKTGDISNKFSKQYLYFEKNAHPDLKPVNLFWNPDIIDIITTILSKETSGRIEPVFDYTKHTLKSFLNFIKSGFSAKTFVTHSGLLRAFEKHEVIEHARNKTNINLFEKIYDFLTLNFEKLHPKLPRRGVSFFVDSISDTPIQLQLNPNSIRIGVKTNTEPSNKWEKDGQFYRINIESIDEFEQFKGELLYSLKRILPE